MGSGGVAPIITELQPLPALPSPPEGQADCIQGPQHPEASGKLLNIISGFPMKTGVMFKGPPEALECFQMAGGCCTRLLVSQGQQFPWRGVAPCGPGPGSRTWARIVTGAGLCVSACTPIICS